MSQFLDTYKMFNEYLDTTLPISYEEFYNLPEEKRAAALYVNFYREINIAWSSFTAPHIYEEDALDTVIQYLDKNAKLMINDPKRYTAKYVYRVVHNCLHCLCVNVQKTKDRYKKEISMSLYDDNDNEMNIIDFAITHLDIYKVNDTSDLEEWVKNCISQISSKRVINEVTKFLEEDKKDISEGSKAILRHYLKDFEKYI